MTREDEHPIQTQTPAAAGTQASGSRAPGCFGVLGGVVVVLIGIPMLICPGPGFLVIGAGVGMIAAGLGLGGRRPTGT